MLLGIEAEVFSEAGDLAWDVEGFLLACWLSSSEGTVCNF